MRALGASAAPSPTKAAITPRVSAAATTLSPCTTQEKAADPLKAGYLKRVEEFPNHPNIVGKTVWR